MKRYYSEYVSHCLTFYSRYPNLTHFRSNIDRNNWNACKVALDSLSERDREIIMEIHQGNCSVRDCVTTISKKRKISQEQIWQLISAVEHKVAEVRGLL